MKVVMLIAVLSALLGSQQVEKPPKLKVVVFGYAEGAGFTHDALRDAATTLLAARMPDVEILDVESESGGPLLTVHLRCVEPTLTTGARPGLACGLWATMSTPLWDAPFGGVFASQEANDLMLWRNVTVLVGPTREILDMTRSVLERWFDGFVANWRDLSEDQRRCWIGYLNDGASSDAVRGRWHRFERPTVEHLEPADVADPVAWEALLTGPCGAFDPSR